MLNWFLNLDTYYITDEEVKDIKSRRKNVSVKNHPITMARAKYLFTLYVWTKI
uniref:Alanyl-tRNA synthetase n=3 Tax=Viruses TaxID=10239 RepID=A0A8S5PK55_9CAUD|nr:MAG TPA: alanyl-tRNA synthetase [Siphoviridae sp. ctJcm18]DAE06556.1 MAG TPA: alanyl-tRNA synthetase [Siphoviridae sp. ctUGQ45]DAE27289.1 MAG TPA: alanyl-tRNA synthetase [virus sp. ct8MV80]DAW91570.1 MAG TPA: alanyl-tRNA synthetase [Bacteriophage sp.]